MVFKSVNPKNGKLLKTYECITNKDLSDKLERSIKCFKFMKNQGASGLQQRFDKLENVKKLMALRRQVLAETITNEMGKCIKESYGEVDKSIAMIDYSIKNAEGFLRDQEIAPSKYAKATVVQQPWGPSLSKLFFLMIKVSCHGTFRFGFHSRSAYQLWSEGTQS
jgi:succinate-semialdehyde dehydrogenase / glutarate-semialdehyde dehydrogenase